MGAKMEVVCWLVSVSLTQRKLPGERESQLMNCPHQIGLLACMLGSFPLRGMISLPLGEPARQLLVTAEMGVPLLHH